MVESSALEGDVVMNGPDNAPLLILSRRGKGRVATFLSDHVWLWARGYEGGGPHSDLLRRMSHWLMKEPDLEEEYLRATADRQGIIIERHSMKDEVGEAKVTTPTDKTVTVPMEKVGPGLWRGKLTATEPGLHKINMDELSAVALVGTANSREFSKVAATDEPIHPISDATGGGQFWMGGTNGKAAKDLPRLAMLQSANALLRPELAWAEGPRGLCGARRAIYAAAGGLPGARAVPGHHHPNLVPREPLTPGLVVAHYPRRPCRRIATAPQPSARPRGSAPDRRGRAG